MPVQNTSMINEQRIKNSSTYRRIVFRKGHDLTQCVSQEMPEKNAIIHNNLKNDKSFIQKIS